MKPDRAGMGPVCIGSFSLLSSCSKLSLALLRGCHLPAVMLILDRIFHSKMSALFCSGSELLWRKGKLRHGAA